jgi:N-acylneuraminate cytidylyltransferase
VEKNKVKLLVCDVDGTLTDGTAYYSIYGEELKRFSMRDGSGFHILHHKYPNVKVAWITSECGGINKRRWEKLFYLGTVHDFADNVYGVGKVEKIKRLCEKYNIIPEEVAYIGDDVNDYEALEYVGFPACPYDANHVLQNVLGICVMSEDGGNGAVREFIDYLINEELL